MAEEVIAAPKPKKTKSSSPRRSSRTAGRSTVSAAKKPSTARTTKSPSKSAETKPAVKKTGASKTVKTKTVTVTKKTKPIRTKSRTATRKSSAAKTSHSATTIPVVQLESPVVHPPLQTVQVSAPSIIDLSTPPLLQPNAQLILEDEVVKPGKQSIDRRLQMWLAISVTMFLIILLWSVALPYTLHQANTTASTTNSASLNEVMDSIKTNWDELKDSVDQLNPATNTTNSVPITNIPTNEELDNLFSNIN
jgi:hypothetical protein